MKKNKKEQKIEKDWEATKKNKNRGLPGIYGMLEERDCVKSESLICLVLL
jgi:hypothetical protein